MESFLPFKTFLHLAVYTQPMVASLLLWPFCGDGALIKKRQICMNGDGFMSSYKELEEGRVIGTIGFY